MIGIYKEYYLKKLMTCIFNTAFGQFFFPDEDEHELTALRQLLLDPITLRQHIDRLLANGPALSDEPTYEQLTDACSQLIRDTIENHGVYYF
jgi:hypothetical protein